MEISFRIYLGIARELEVRVLQLHSSKYAFSALNYDSMVNNSLRINRVKERQTLIRAEEFLDRLQGSKVLILDTKSILFGKKNPRYSHFHPPSNYFIPGKCVECPVDSDARLRKCCV